MVGKHKSFVSRSKNCNWPELVENLQTSADVTSGGNEVQNGIGYETASIYTSEDDRSENETEILASDTDSMWTTSDFVSDSERQEIYNFAPGEANRPLSVFRDQYSEEMDNPGIFLGHKRPDDKKKAKRCLLW